MQAFIRWIIVFLGVIAIGAFFYLKTPQAPKFDISAAQKAAEAYNARIIRDSFGVPHIYGERDADVAFGLAYAHAEDDWKTIEEVLFFSRGALAQHMGKSAAITDYLVQTMGAMDDINARYETDISPETRALAEGYAAGLNFYCTEKKSRCAAGAVPVTGHDIVAGFAARTPFFYGLDGQLKNIFDGNIDIAKMADSAREAYLRIPRGFELGSNAIAVAPSRSADGHTRLMVNSHQPYTGPVAWYEARVKSQEGWDMVGALFPGAPMILHGAGPDLGWAFTVNKPDLVDVYKLDVDDPEKPTRYRFDGEWRNFKQKKVKFRVHLWGPFSLPVTRLALYSVHGPVFITGEHVFAVSYGGQGDIRAIEQYYRLNRARNYAEWRAAMEMLAIPSSNVVYADGSGVIAYYYYAALPKRTDEVDWSLAQAGDDPALLWQGKRTLNDVPQVVMPLSGYVVNANHTPFQSSGEQDNPNPGDFPANFGIDTRTTNRGLRIQTLYGGDTSITSDEFVSYKMDYAYAENSRLMEMVRTIIETPPKDSEGLREAIDILRQWNGDAKSDNRSAALAILTGQKARGPLLNDEGIRSETNFDALRETAELLKAEFGRLDPKWGEVTQLIRGSVSAPLDGGPDTLRAVYPAPPEEGFPLPAVGGDTYILYADWSAPDEVEIKTIHQFGSATLDETSPHYADQSKLFANEEWKKPPMTLGALLEEATADYRVGDR